MRTDATTREETAFAQLLTRKDTVIHGFFWCGGSTWDARDYRVVLLAGAGREWATIERIAATPEALALAMVAAGCEAVDDLAALCERAASSPKPPRRRNAS